VGGGAGRAGGSREAIDSLLVESIHLQLDAFAERADRLVSPAPQGPQGTPVPLDVHELRIAGKALRYTLEMARAHGRPLDRHVTRTFKRMQDALGLWHEFVVVTEWAMRASLEGLLAHHDTKLQADVLALARLTLSSGGKRLKKFATLWSEEGRAVAETIRASFPITKPAAPSESGTGPDPSRLLNRQRRQQLRQAQHQPLEHGPLAVGVERADDRHPRLGRLRSRRGGASPR
jgi:hypothetical protein